MTSMTLIRSVLATTLLATVVSQAMATEHSRSAPRTAALVTDSSDVAAVVAKYHSALASGDSAAAIALLADDAVVLETGSVETKSEYRSRHLPADIEFARVVPAQRSAIVVRVRGDVAWASSTSTTQGEFRGRAINSSGAELMVLSREEGGWKIRAIHWSSRTRRAGT
jgi:ketosteroid isomerase-like protein